MRHDPFLYDFVAEHQHALCEAAARADGVGARVGGGCRSVCPRRRGGAGCPRSHRAE
jgi:hypothetical protein